MSQIMICFVLLFVNSVLATNFKTKFKNLPFQTKELFIQLNSMTGQKSNPELNAICYINSNGTIYNLNRLYNKNWDYNKTFSDGNRLYLNFCQNVINDCTNSTSFATLVKKNQCITLANKNYLKYKIKFNNKTNETLITGKLPSGDSCGLTNYQLTYKFVCNKSVESPIIDFSGYNQTSCNNSINIVTKYACPRYNDYSMFNNIMYNNYIFGSIIIVAGVYLLFLGGRFLIITQITTGVAFFMLFILFFIIANFSIYLNNTYFWVVVASTIIVGAGFGYLISFIHELPPVILSAIAGFLFGTIFYNSIVFNLMTSAVVLRWIVIISMILIFSFLACFYSDIMLIISSCVVGSFAIIRGISFMVGYYPNDLFIYRLVKYYEWIQLKNIYEWQIYLYIVGFFVLFLIGFAVQIKYKIDIERKPPGPDDIEEEKDKLIQK